MPVYELRRFEVRCSRDDCTSAISVDVEVNVRLTPIVERQIIDAVKREDWRVRAVNTPEPTFICPVHFEE